MVGTNGAPKEIENAAWQAIVAVVVVAASERERQRETEKEFLLFFPSFLQNHSSVSSAAGLLLLLLLVPCDVVGCWKAIMCFLIPPTTVSLPPILSL
jgi:hypothetical protein